MVSKETEQFNITDDVIAKALQYKKDQELIVLRQKNINTFDKLSNVISCFQLVGLSIIPFGILFFLCYRFHATLEMYLSISNKVLLVSAIVNIIVLLLRFIFTIIKNSTLNQKMFNKYSWINNIEAITLLIALVLTVITTVLFYSKNGLSEIVLPGNGYNHEGLYTVIMYAIVFASAFSINKDFIKKYFLYLLLFVGLVTSIATLLIKITGADITNSLLAIRYIAGPFNNSNHYGYFTCIISLVAAGFIVFADKEWEMIIGTIFLIPFELCLLISKTLGSNLGFIFGILIIIIMCIFTKRSSFFRILLLLGIALLVFIVSETSKLTNMINDYVVLNNGVNTIAEDATSEAAKKAGSSRWGLWLGTIECIKVSPWLGKGLDCYYGSNAIDSSLDMPHNEYLQIASNVGIPVFVLYLLSIAITVFRAIKYRYLLSNTNMIMLAIMSGYCVSAFFGNTFTYTYPYFLIIWAFAIPKVNTKIIHYNYCLDNSR